MANESMVERVMRALTEVIADRIPNNRSALDAVGCSYEMARAAIAAMREPSEKMIEAGGTEFIAYDRIYQRMIDAALKG